MNTTINITDYASPALREMMAGVSAARLNPRLGAAVSRLVQDHLAMKEGQPNKSGFPSQHFYANAARSTFWTADSAGATVTISQTGFAQRCFGGTIKPGRTISKFTGRPTQYLTIPARGEASGKRAGEFGNLKVLWGRNGPYALAADEGGATRRVFQGREGTRPEHPVKGLERGVIVFWLVKEVTQDADPSVLPSEEEVQTTLAQTTASAISRIK